MKGIEITAPLELTLKEYPSISLKDNEIRIAIAFCGICGSDLKSIIQPVKIAQIPGHEFSGRVIEVGDYMKDRFKIGDRVTVFPMIACMECPECHRKMYRDCPYKQSIGFQLPGAFAQEIIVNGNFVIKLFDNISYEQGALIEHLCCGYRLIKEITDTAHILPSEEVHILIIGDGPIALADLQNLKAASFSNILLIGKHENRKKMAEKLGASRVIDYTEFNRAKKDLQPVDICIFSAPAEETLDQFIDLMKSSSIFYPQTRVKNPKILDRLKRVNIGRAFTYFWDDFEAMMILILNGTIQTAPLVTQRVPLLEVPDVFRDFYKKENKIKVLIENEIF